MTTEKQIEANKRNAKLGGVKTPKGKIISCYNSQKHMILRESLTEYESTEMKNILDGVFEHFKPKDQMEGMLVERIGVCLVKLIRLGKAEGEYIKSALYPKVVDNWEGLDMVIDKGYEPKIGKDFISELGTVYSRYETAIENRMFRLMHELERLKRLKNGENLPVPIVADVNNLGSFGNN